MVKYDFSLWNLNTSWRFISFSVAGFITEVQAFQQLATGTTTTPGSGLSGGPGSHGGHDSGKPPQVTWARFETVDLNDRTLYPESMEINGIISITINWFWMLDVLDEIHFDTIDGWYDFYLN